MTTFWRQVADGVIVAVKVQPKARRRGIQGTAITGDGERLRIGVTEAAEEGRANRAACVALAEVLGVAPSTIHLTVGTATREKTLHVAGDPTALAAKLATL